MGITIVLATLLGDLLPGGTERTIVIGTTLVLIVLGLPLLIITLACGIAIWKPLQINFAASPTGPFCIPWNPSPKPQSLSVHSSSQPSREQ